MQRTARCMQGSQSTASTPVGKCFALNVTAVGLGRNLELEESERLALENIKDIIACGFDVHKTFIFTDFGYCGGDFNRNTKRIERQGLWSLWPLKHGGAYFMTMHSINQVVMHFG